jgi:uncharacterized protein
VDTTSKTPNESFIQSFTRIIITLAVIQLTRATAYRIIGLAGIPAASDITDAASIILTGMIVWKVTKPQANTLGQIEFPAAKTRFLYAGIGAVLLLLAGVNIVLDPSQLMPTFISCIVFPLFEEPLFRGWVWNRINPTLPPRGNGLTTILITSLLFAIWHLGYWDVVALHIPAGTTLPVMAHIMLMKMVIAVVIGLATGFLRWKTGSTYSSILFHAFWNLFGR